jgi:hypothetical protein
LWWDSALPAGTSPDPNDESTQRDATKSIRKVLLDIVKGKKVEGEVGEK